MVASVGLAAALGCSVNILEAFSDETDADYILVEVKKSINKQDFAAALSQYQTLPASAQAQRENKLLLATIHLGLCGLSNFLQFIEDLGANANPLLKMFMATFGGATVANYSSCIDAENAIKSISDSAGDRSVEENLIMAFIGMAKMGSILANKFDVNADGATDGGLDACDNTSPLPSALAKEVATGFGNMMLSLAATAGATAVGADQFAAFNAACTALNTLGPSLNFCGVYDTANVTASMEKGVRSMIKESQDVGLGVSCTGNLSSCNCP
jgi:hypothetical protein